MARHGQRQVAGDYPADLTLETFDPLFEAIVRGTFDEKLEITQATGSPPLTSVTTTANTIVAASGSFIAAGLRVGDVIRLSGFQDAENNGRNIRITGLTANTITTPDILKA